MKNILHPLLLLILILSGVNLEAKNYTHKAERPSTSDHTWYGYDWDFNLDENGMLTGTNTFSKVYNTVPPRWHNTTHWGEGIKMYTGHETLTIAVLPGDDNWKYTITTSVVEWTWDTHILKWVKRCDMPTNGTRTFTIKNGILEGKFEIPVVAGILGVNFLCGTSTNGVIKNGEKLLWKIYDYSNSSPINGLEITSEGDSIHLDLSTYMEDVEKRTSSRGLGTYGTDETGTYVELVFPYTKGKYENDILITAADYTGVGMYALKNYSEITLPEVYYDKYTSPYAPVTEILSNGHKRITTLQPDQHRYYVETWSENGYNYEYKYEGIEDTPTVGTKVVNDTTFIHAYTKSFEERGFKIKGQYYMTYVKENKKLTEIDWSNFKENGFGTFTFNGNKYWFTLNPDKDKPYFMQWEINSPYQNEATNTFIIKEQDADGNTTVSSAYTAELSIQAKKFIDFVNHPYIKKEYPSKYTISQVTMTPDGRLFTNSKPQYTDKGYLEYCNNMRSLCNGPQNPIIEMQNIIGMELDIPDYDVVKFDAKVIGKRTAKLIKELPKWLNVPLHDGSMKLNAKGIPYQDIWPNGVKRAFLKDNRFNDFKKATVTRLVKHGKTITIYVTTLDKKGKEKVTTLILEDNLPMDEYNDVWRILGTHIK